jgi:hypothetical protein
MDSGGRLWLADYDDATVRVLVGGAVRTLIGSGERGTRTGFAYNATLQSPIDLVVAPDGTVYLLTFGDGSNFDNCAS